MSNTISIPGGRKDEPFVASRIQRNNRLRTRRRIAAIEDLLRDPTLGMERRAALEAERGELQARFR